MGLRFIQNLNALYDRESVASKNVMTKTRVDASRNAKLLASPI